MFVRAPPGEEGTIPLGDHAPLGVGDREGPSRRHIGVPSNRIMGACPITVGRPGKIGGLRVNPIGNRVDEGGRLACSPEGGRTKAALHEDVLFSCPGGQDLF